MRCRRIAALALVSVIGVSLLDGCLLSTRSIAPPVPGKVLLAPVGAPVAYALAYELSDTSDWSANDQERGERDQLREILRECLGAVGLAPARELEVAHGNGAMAESAAVLDTAQFILVRVSHHPYLSGGGGAMLSGLSLGIIPSVEKYDVYDVRFSRYVGGKSRGTSAHTIRQKDMFHLILLPVFWLNFMQPSRQEEFRRVLIADLAGA